MYEKNRWSLSLTDLEPALVPVKNGYPFAITQIHVSNAKSDRVVVELIADIVRLDKLSDEDDTAVTQIDNIVIAVIYPNVSCDARVMIPFSQYNQASLRSSGGDIQVSGVYSKTQSEFENM